MFKKIAVILSDSPEEVIFSIPALKGMRTKHPYSALHLFVNAEYRDLLPSFSMCDAIYTLDPLSIRSASSGKNQNVEDLLKEHLGVAANAYDLVVNLNNNDLSALIATYLANEEVIGAHFEQNSEIAIRGDWAQYCYANVGHSIVNPFHLADLNKYVCSAQGEDAGIELAAIPIASELVAKSQAFPKGIKIGLVLTPEISIESYCSIVHELCTQFPRANICYLSGGISDEQTAAAGALANELSGESNLPKDRLLDCTQVGSYAELTHLVDGRHLVIGPLSLTTHLTAGVGTFTITFAKCDQTLFERGPYGHGHLVFADELQDVRGFTIPRGLASATVDFATNAFSGRLPDSQAWAEFWQGNAALLPASFKVLAAERVVFEQQDGVQRTDLIYKSIFNRGSTLQECLFSFYRLIWQFDLNNSEDVIPDLKIARIDTVKGMVNLLDTLEKIYRLAGFGQKYSLFVNDSLRKQNLKQAKEDSARLDEIDRMIHQIGVQIPAVAPICRFYSLHQFQNRSEDPLVIAEDAILSYDRLQAHISIIVDLVNDLIVRTDKKIPPRRLEDVRVDR